jgi:hypothetical protein
MAAVAMVVAPVAGSPAAGPAGHRRSLASRGAPSMLARHSRHPGRPRIDSTCRDLIWRLAATVTDLFANHLGDVAFMPAVMSSSAPGNDDVVDAADLPGCPVRSFSDRLSAANQWAIIDSPGSQRDTFLGRRLVQGHVCDGTRARNRTDRAPPLHLRVQAPSRRSASGTFAHADIGPLPSTTA